MAHQLLLADDSVTIQRVIKLTFADEDVEVVTVGDGNLAVAAMDKQAPDIVLADVAMPGRSGYDVAQHIRQTPALAHIPILLLTGAFEPVDEARASEVGCDGVLAKPFEPEQVVSRVKELLARPRPVAAPVAAPAPPPPVFPVAVNEVATAPPAPLAPVTAASPSPIFPAPVPPPPAPTTATAKPPADVDAYFERLDQAFATLALSPRPATPAMPEPEAAPAISPALADAFAGLSAAAPATPVAPFAPAASAAPPAPTAAAPALSWASASTASPSTSSPSFTSPAAAVQSTPPPVNTTGLTDAQIAQIVDRVVEALTVRLGVNLADVVSTVAERLVRDEINQIRKRV